MSDPVPARAKIVVDLAAVRRNVRLLKQLAAPARMMTVVKADGYGHGMVEVARAAREIAHGALQVFGGVAFTQEHPAHRFLRRIVVREQQFGDAAHHERALGRMLAERAARQPVGTAVG